MSTEANDFFICADPTTSERLCSEDLSRGATILAGSPSSLTTRSISLGQLVSLFESRRQRDDACSSENAWGRLAPSHRASMASRHFAAHSSVLRRLAASSAGTNSLRGRAGLREFPAKTVGTTRNQAAVHTSRHATAEVPSSSKAMVRDFTSARRRDADRQATGTSSPNIPIDE